MDSLDYRALADRLDLDAKVLLTAGADSRETAEIPVIGLQALTLVDGPSAVNAARAPGDQPPLGPCPTGIGASWDRDLAARIGAMQGGEARRRGVHMILGPNINLERSPLAGRAFEYYSEDPFLAGTIGAAWITGLQSCGVGAVAKHLVCNDSETKRHSMNAVVGERALREVYLRPFEMAVEAGTWGVMTAYNRVNGIRCAEQPIVRDILKAEWGFDGIVMSDWHGAHDTVASAAAGLDLEMPGPAKVFGPHLALAIRNGTATEAALDDSVIRFLRTADRVGALEAQDTPRPDALDRGLLIEAAAASFVLLRNEGVLPLATDSLKRVAVIGPNAAEPAYQGGTLGQIALSPDIPVPVDKLREALPGVEIDHQPGVLAAPRLPALAKVNAAPARDSQEAGMRLDYFHGRGSSGTPAASEVSARGSVVWFGRMPGTGSLQQDATVRMTCVITPATTGEHLLRAGGSGDIRMWLDGKLIGEKPKPRGEDTMGDLLWPQLLDVAIDLLADAPVEIVVEMYSDATRARSFHFACRAPEPAGMMERAEAAAAAADAAIVIVGETTDNAMESVDRQTTKLPGLQADLIRRVCAVNPRTIVVVNAGHAVDMPWADMAGAVMMTWFPGEEFGQALADVIVGTREPGGRLPVTIARDEGDYAGFNLTPIDGDVVYEEQTLIGGRWLEARGKQPHFALGHGLGYATTALEAARLIRTEDGGASIELTLRNLSDRRAKAVPQAYVRALDDPDNPASELASFDAFHLDPGESRVVTLTIAPRALAHWNVETQQWCMRPGAYQIRLGWSLSNIVKTFSIVFGEKDPSASAAVRR